MMFHLQSIECVKVNNYEQVLWKSMRNNSDRDNLSDFQHYSH